MRVLITGAGGFVGGHLMNTLAAGGHDPIGVVRAVRPAGQTQARYLTADLAKLPEVESALEEGAPDLIIHCAAASNSTACQADPAMAWSCNVTAVENLCQAATQGQEPIPLIHFSTDLVFDDYEQAPPGEFSEDTQPRARTVYGRSKLEAERIVLEYPAAMIFRTALVYGPPAGAAAGMMGWLIEAGRNNRPVQLFTDEWRTPVFVGDIARAVDAAICLNYMKSADRSDRLIHLAGPERISRYTFGQIAAEVLHFDPAMYQPASREEFLKKNHGVPHRPADVSLQINRLVNRLKIEPIGVRKGLKSFA